MLKVFSPLLIAAFLLSCQRPVEVAVVRQSGAASCAVAPKEASVVDESDGVGAVALSSSGGAHYIKKRKE